MIVHIPAFSSLKRQYQIGKNSIIPDESPWSWVYLDAESQIHREFAEITTKEQIVEFCNKYGAICSYRSVDWYLEKIEYVRFLLTMPKDRWTEQEIFDFNKHLSWNVNGEIKVDATQDKYGTTLHKESVVSLTPCGGSTYNYLFILIYKELFLDNDDKTIVTCGRTKFYY